MHNGFTRMMIALWGDLELGDPAWDEDGAALLPIDDMTVELSLSGDGRFVLAALDIAPLHADRSRQHMQIDALLRLSLLGLTASRGAICFEDMAGGQKRALIKGLCPCEMGQLPLLSEMIADLIHLREEALQVLVREEGSGTRSTDYTPLSNGEENLIFTP